MNPNETRTLWISIGAAIFAIFLLYSWSQEQKQQMRAVWNRYRNDVHDLRYNLMEKRIEARKLFTDPKADQAAILAKERELNGLRQKLMERTMQAKLEWRSILTPEQIAKLDSMPRRHATGRCQGMM